mgnify:CR=1 FL=1
MPPGFGLMDLGMKQIRGMDAYNEVQKEYTKCLEENDCVNKTIMCHKQCNMLVSQNA